MAPSDTFPKKTSKKNRKCDCHVRIRQRHGLAMTEWWEIAAAVKTETTDSQWPDEAKMLRLQWPNTTKSRPRNDWLSDQRLPRSLRYLAMTGWSNGNRCARHTPSARNDRIFFSVLAKKCICLLRLKQSQLTPLEWSMEKVLTTPQIEKAIATHRSQWLIEWQEIATLRSQWLDGINEIATLCSQWLIERQAITSHAMTIEKRATFR